VNIIRSPLPHLFFQSALTVRGVVSLSSSSGITETEMSALYEFLAISLQSMDTILNKELFILKERPAVGRLDR